MSSFPHRPTKGRGRETTVATVIETIDAEKPTTKDDLAELVGLSPNYLSEILHDLKESGVVSKAYVVHDEAVYRHATDISALWNAGVASESPNRDDLLTLLQRLDDVTVQQYRAAARAFDNETREQTAVQLEGLANERYSAALGELKSYTISTQWPGNRVSSSLAAVAKNLEIVGDRACFIEDVIDTTDQRPTGAVHDRVVEVFEAGEEIHDLVAPLLFDQEIENIEPLHATEHEVHRDLAELFELTTAYDERTYGYLLSVTRALERILHHWVNTAETAVRLHVGLDPGHVEI